MHDIGVVHRDLKLENVIIQKDYDDRGLQKFSVRIIDFGLSTPFDI